MSEAFAREGVCEYHIFDCGNYENKVPKELKRAYYHRWGLQKQDPNANDPVPGKSYYGLRDSIKLLGHEKLETIDVFKIDCKLLIICNVVEHMHVCS